MPQAVKADEALCPAIPERAFHGVDPGVFQDGRERRGEGLNGSLRQLAAELRLGLKTDAQEELAKLSERGNDDMFLPCDDWATVKYGSQAKYRYDRRQKNGT
mgnify:CR=1 FL=1